MSPIQPKIAIVGAGPAGCMLNKLLAQANINSVVFEGEKSSSGRIQGSTLDLHDDTGMLAIRKASLWEKVSDNLRYDGEAMKLLDDKLNAHIVQEPETEETSTGRPEIDRSALRHILVDALPEGTIRWDHKVRSVSEDGTIHFQNGKEEKFDLVIGADGAWSKVRPLLTEQKPVYTGLGGVSLIIDDPATQHPDLYKFNNRGTIMACGKGKSITAQQLGDGSIYVYTFNKTPENWKESSGLDLNDATAVRQHFAEVYKDWDPLLVKYTQVAKDSDIQLRNLYMLPIGHTWEHRKGFTLIGDAAHLMGPFAGEGVNLALRDALELSKAIIGAVEGGDLDQSIQKFEEEMLAFAKPFQQETYDNMNTFFSDDADAIPRAIRNGMFGPPPDEE